MAERTMESLLRDLLRRVAALERRLLRTPRSDAYTYVQTRYFTSSDTFDKDDYPGLRAIRVRVVGGGGAGGGAQTATSGNFSYGTGGGGGEYAEGFITDI